MRHLLFMFLSLLLAASANAASPPADLEKLRRDIQEVLDQTNTPAVGVALVNREGPYWVAGLGKADIASNRAANEDTLFRIGSISKMFAALAVLQLVEEGKLSLDDRVRDRAPDVAFENPWEDTHPVRIAHLLEHTTGWDDIHLAEYAYAAPDSMSVKEGLAYHPHSRKSRWLPGTRQAYCNAGPAVAAYIVEKVTGQRFEDYVAQRLFAPLGMDSTTYFKSALYDERGATLYVGPRATSYWQIIFRPSGSINSSARDMAKFLHLMLMRGATTDGALVSPESIERMETPGTTLGNAVGIVAGYGLGNYTSGHENRGLAFRGHNGGVIGGLSELGYIRELGRGYVFMINSGNGAAAGRISNLLKAHVLADVPAPALAATPAPLPQAYREIDGYYRAINPRQDLLRFTLDIVSSQRFSHDEQYFHRKPLFAPWTTSDRVGERGVLIDAWHGLPAIAIVQDPLAGAAVQVNGELFQRVPAWDVYTRLGVPLLLLVCCVVGFIALVVWSARRSRKRTDDTRLMLRLWPLIGAAALVSFLVTMSAAGGFLEYAGTVSPLSVGILLLSLVYPAAVLVGLVNLALPATRARLNLPFWFGAVFMLLHVAIVLYFAAYGLVGLRTWA